MKRSVILTDRLGPDILLVLTMKRQVLHRERAHLKVPGCSLVLSALLTKKRQLLESLYGGQFTLSTPLIKPNFCILLPHRRSTTVSLETTPS